MHVPRAVAVLILMLSGCVSFVGNAPRVSTFTQSWDLDTVHAAVSKVLERRSVWPSREVSGQFVGKSLRTDVECVFTLDYTASGLTVAAVGPSPKDDPSRIDERCDVEARALGKAVNGELTRPERVARKEAKVQRRREEEQARQAAFAAQQAAAAQRYAEEQRYAAELAARQPQQPVQQYPAQQYPAQQYPAQQYPAQQNPAQQYPAQQYPAQQYPAQQYPAQRPAPQPAQPRPAQASSTSTTWSYQSSSPAPAPAAAPQPTMQPNTCCVKGRAFLCPNTTVWAAACVQHTADLATLCPNNPQHDRFCPR